MEINEVMSKKNRAKGVFRVWVGLALVFFGVAFLLEAFGIGDAEQVLKLWPTLVALVLLVFVFRPGAKPGLLWPAVVVAGGALVQLHTLGVLHLRAGVTWPLLLILAGLYMFRSALWPRQKGGKLAAQIGPGSGSAATEPPASDGAVAGAAADPAGQTPSGEAQASGGALLSDLVVFSGRDRRIVGPGFMGGSVTAIFGGYALDLRQAELASGTVELQATAAFGGVEIRVPESWNVQAEGAALLGAIENKTQPPPAESTGPARRLIVRGTALFGGVEIKN
jgi:hypothetical protein